MQQVDANPEHFGGAYIDPSQSGLCVLYAAEFNALVAEFLAEAPSAR